jgi:hypothetical protein
VPARVPEQVLLQQLRRYPLLEPEPQGLALRLAQSLRLEPNLQPVRPLQRRWYLLLAQELLLVHEPLSAHDEPLLAHGLLLRNLQHVQAKLQEPHVQGSGQKRKLQILPLKRKFVLTCSFS